ncbi:MAG: MFS transporter, partial [Ktedonobacteraceae bacterium]|nr:MFS transporter [Ktedonobacteraceae bacterium]
MKCFYLGYFSAIGVYFPYFGLYLGTVGLSGTQIGLIASILPFASMVMPPLWGVFSDRYGWRKRLLMIALLGAMSTSFLLWLIAHAFVPLLLLMLGFALVVSPVIPLADAMTLQWMNQHGGSYGTIRIYGSLGFLIVAIASGAILNAIGILSFFLLLSIVFCVPFLASLFMPDHRQVSMARSSSRTFVSLFRDRVLLLFLLLCMVGYGTFASYNTFFGLYVHGLGVDTTAIGFASGLATLSELPTMMLSGFLMQRLGVKWLLLIGLGIAVLRWFAYATFTNYPVLFAFTLLHGISFASFYIAAITFIDRRVPTP